MDNKIRTLKKVTYFVYFVKCNLLNIFNKIHLYYTVYFL